MSARRVTQEEIRSIQLEMLDEIDRFCKDQGIKYSLAFGTMLGAIRHRGYIPWDDDVDIIMPIKDMLRLKQEFRSNKLRYCDVDTEPDYEYHFSRIVYSPTFSKVGRFHKSYGVSIDLYPVVGLPGSMDEIQKFFKSEEKLLNKRKKYIIWRKRIMRLLPIRSLPGFGKTMRDFKDSVLDAFPYETSEFKLHAGRLHPDNVFDFDVFDELINVPFEGHKYCVPARYDAYLSHCYGDYMQLPPEDQRHPYHGFVYYWKSDSDII